MRTPSILAQCLPGLIPHDKTGHGFAIVSERDSNFPLPAVEIVPSKHTHPYKYAGGNLDLQGINIFRGRVSVADIIGFSSLETVSCKQDGSLKSWESSIDLVNVLKLDIRDGQLSFRGKRVLELSCGFGLPGIFACLKGAATVHFHDVNAENIRRATIPNVLANLEQSRDRLSRQSESPVTPLQLLAPDVHFYAGDWAELHTVLSLVQMDTSGAAAGTCQSFSEEDLMDGCSSQDGSFISHEAPGRRSRKLSGSRAWERASEADQGDAGYDVILIADLPYSARPLKKLYKLITRCLRPPYGVLYVGTKKNYVGSNGGVRQLRNLMDEECLFGAHLVAELSDREIWKFFFVK